MKKAIITGATGLVGMAVARYLSSHGVELLCLGRQSLSNTESNTKFGEGATYLKLPMEEIASLSEKLESLAWMPGSGCVFFNFAWQGRKKLTDGSFEDQLRNAVNAAEAVRVAKNLGCTKFVNAGTLEESFIEQSLEKNNTQSYLTTQADYTLAKLASRDMCRMIAYLEKIDYVHTRLSVPLAKNLSGGTYVSETLKKIIEGKPFDPPINNKLFDVVFTDDVARAYYLIGFHGRNKANYFIGTERPATLEHYFKRFAHLVKGNDFPEAEINVSDKSMTFDVSPLHADTGFMASSRFEEIIEKVSGP